MSGDFQGYWSKCLGWCDVERGQRERSRFAGEGWWAAWGSYRASQWRCPVKRHQMHPQHWGGTCHSGAFWKSVKPQACMRSSQERARHGIEDIAPNPETVTLKAKKWRNIHRRLWRSGQNVGGRSVSRDVFLNLILEQDRIRQSFQGALDGWGSPPNGKHDFHFTIPGHFLCWHHLVIVPAI